MLVYFPFDQGTRSSRSADAWALPSLRAMAKVSISSLVVVGAKEIIRSGKLYDESVDLPAVIKSAMDKAAAQAERSLCFMKAEAFASVDAMERRGFELDTADLSTKLSYYAYIVTWLLAVLTQLTILNTYSCTPAVIL